MSTIANPHNFCGARTIWGLITGNGNGILPVPNNLQCRILTNYDILVSPAIKTTHCYVFKAKLNPNNKSNQFRNNIYVYTSQIDLLQITLSLMLVTQMYLDL